MLNLKHDTRSDQSNELGVVTAKVVGLIGLCHSFVNDPVLLKANNQWSLNNNDAEESKDERINAA